MLTARTFTPQRLSYSLGSTERHRPHHQRVSTALTAAGNGDWGGETELLEHTGHVGGLGQVNDGGRDSHVDMHAERVADQRVPPSVLSDEVEVLPEKSGHVTTRWKKQGEAEETRTLSTGVGGKQSTEARARDGVHSGTSFAPRYIHTYESPSYAHTAIRIYASKVRKRHSCFGSSKVAPQTADSPLPPGCRSVYTCDKKTKSLQPNRG